jgi:hypothetical protein
VASVIGEDDLVEQLIPLILAWMGAPNREGSEKEEKSRFSTGMTTKTKKAKAKTKTEADSLLAGWLSEGLFGEGAAAGGAFADFDEGFDSDEAAVDAGDVVG